MESKIKERFQLGYTKIAETFTIFAMRAMGAASLRFSQHFYYVLVYNKWWSFSKVSWFRKELHLTRK